MWRCLVQRGVNLAEGTRFQRDMRLNADGSGRHAWIETVLKRFDHRRLKRADRGAVSTDLRRLRCRRHAQVTPLVTRWVARKQRVKQYRRVPNLPLPRAPVQCFPEKTLNKSLECGLPNEDSIQ